MMRQSAELSGLPSDDWFGRLEQWMTSSVRFYLDYARLHEALFARTRNLGSSQSFADASTNPHVRSLRETLEAGTEGGAFALRPATTATVLLYSTMHGAAHHMVSKAPDGAAHREVDEVTEQLHLLCRRYLDPIPGRAPFVDSAAESTPQASPHGAP